MNRSFLILLCIVLFPIVGFAQVSYIYDGEKEEETSSSDRLGIYLSGGFTNAHTDFKTTVSHPSPIGTLGFNYNSNDYFILNIDVSGGRFSGSTPLANSEMEPGFKNSFITGTFTFRFLPFGLVPEKDRQKGILRLLSNAYFGFGAGFVKSNTVAEEIANTDYGSLKEYKGVDFLVPFEGGIYFKLASLSSGSRLMGNVNVRTNLSFTDRLDGYVPTVDANNYNDAYSSVSLGIVYRFSAN